MASGIVSPRATFAEIMSAMPTSKKKASQTPFEKRMETLEKLGLVETFDPEEAEALGIFEDDAMSTEDALDAVSPMTPQELESLSEYIDLAGATLKELDPELLQMPFEKAMEGLKKVLARQGKDIDRDKAPNSESKECDAVAKLKRSRFVQLSLVPEFVPAANAAIRSRLFTTGTGPRYKFDDFTPIATWHKNLEVSYAGEELRQEECSVWIQLCKFAASDPDFRISTTRYKLLKALNKEDSGENRNVLKQQLLRLFKGQLRIVFGEIEYYGSILPDFAIENKGKGKIVANLNKTISKLLGLYDFTMLNMDVRLSLPPMAQWFHAFVKSQDGPEISIPWVQIHELSGSKESNLENYKKNFRKAVLKPLKEIGFIIEAKSRGGNLLVQFDKRKG
jgi:hypothetical protein